MTKLIAVALAAMLASFNAFADSGFVVKPSAHSVAGTIDRLEGLLKAKGIAVVARVDHGAAAKKADMKLNPTQLLIFGNPKLGTPLMQSNQTIGIDLPLKVLAWQDNAGKVWVGYSEPSELTKRHGIENRDDVAGKISGVLKQLVGEAVKP